MRLLLISFLLLTAGFISAQKIPNLTKANTVTTFTYWNPGDKHTYHAVQRKSVYKDGKEKPQSELVTEYDISFQVMNATDSSYEVEMVYSHYILPEAYSDMELDLGKITENIKVRYLTDEFGGFITILNKKEVVTILQQTLDVVSQKVSEKVAREKGKKSAEDMAAFELKMTGLKSVIASEENVDAFFSDDILILHGMYGQELVLGKPATFDVEYPALEQFVLKGSGTVTLNEINKAQDFARFDVLQQPDPAEVKEFIQILFGRLMPEGEELKISDYKFSSKSRLNYIMSLSTGWIQKVSATTTTTVVSPREEQKSVEKVTFEMKN